MKSYYKNNNNNLFIGKIQLLNTIWQNNKIQMAWLTGWLVIF